MYLISAGLAGLLAQILPVFIVLLVLEQNRFNRAHTLDYLPLTSRPVALGSLSGRRLALLSVNVLSVVLCLVVVQLGDQGFRDLNEAAIWTDIEFVAAALFSTVIYASSLSVLVFFTIFAWRIAYKEIVSSPDFRDAANASSDR